MAVEKPDFCQRQAQIHLPRPPGINQIFPREPRLYCQRALGRVSGASLSTTTQQKTKFGDGIRQFCKQPFSELLIWMIKSLPLMNRISRRYSTITARRRKYLRKSLGSISKLAIVRSGAERMQWVVSKVAGNAELILRGFIGLMIGTLNWII